MCRLLAVRFNDRINVDMQSTTIPNAMRGKFCPTMKVMTAADTLNTISPRNTLRSLLCTRSSCK